MRTGRPVQRVRIELAPQAIEIDLARTAIIVIDMQNDFCSSSGWLAHIGVDTDQARQPIAPLNELLPMLRASDVPVIWMNWGNRADRLNLSPALLHVYNGDGQGTGLGDPLPEGLLRGEKVLELGSRSAALVDGLAVAAGDIRIDKYRMTTRK